MSLESKISFCDCDSHISRKNYLTNDKPDHDFVPASELERDLDNQKSWAEIRYRNFKILRSSQRDPGYPFYQFIKILSGFHYRKDQRVGNGISLL